MGDGLLASNRFGFNGLQRTRASLLSFGQSYPRYISQRQITRLYSMLQNIWDYSASFKIYSRPILPRDTAVFIVHYRGCNIALRLLRLLLLLLRAPLVPHEKFGMVSSLCRRLTLLL